MSDVEKFMNLLQSVDVIPTLTKRESSIALRVDVGDSDNVVGFSGFYVEFCFDLTGKFLNMSIWE